MCVCGGDRTCSKTGGGIELDLLRNSPCQFVGSIEARFPILYTPVLIFLYIPPETTMLYHLFRGNVYVYRNQLGPLFILQSLSILFRLIPPKKSWFSECKFTAGNNKVPSDEAYYHVTESLLITS